MNKMDMIRKFREENGLSVQEMREIMGIVLHPTELRDEFAKAAIQALISYGPIFNNYELARNAYAVADAMLAVRIENKEDTNGI